MNRDNILFPVPYINSEVAMRRQAVLFILMIMFSSVSAQTQTKPNPPNESLPNELIERMMDRVDQEVENYIHGQEVVGRQFQIDYAKQRVNVYLIVMNMLERGVVEFQFSYSLHSRENGVAVWLQAFETAVDLGASGRQKDMEQQLRIWDEKQAR
jgi:hypothetical protein